MLFALRSGSLLAALLHSAVHALAERILHQQYPGRVKLCRPQPVQTPTCADPNLCRPRPGQAGSAEAESAPGEWAAPAIHSRTNFSIRCLLYFAPSLM